MERAAAALAAGDWQVARSCFEAVVAEQEIPQALFGLGSALFWLGETDAAVAAQQRAYARFRRDGDMESAALAALHLCLIFGGSLGNVAAAAGWTARLADLVERQGVAVMAGWLALCRAVHASEGADFAAAESNAQEALRIARGAADPDLELCALSELGATMTLSGQIARGAELLDEAMAGALAGEGRMLETVVFAGCRSITACGRSLQVERAVQWVHASDEFTSRYGNLHLYTTCRTQYGALLFGQGRWAEAEAELREALRIGRASEPLLYGEALAKLAELRVAQGRLEEAEELLTDLQDHPAAAFPQAEIHLRRGRGELAVALLRRRLEPAGPECLDAAPLGELASQAEIAVGEAQGAAERARRLKQTGERTGCLVLIARGARGLGRAALAVGDRETAADQLARALDGFGRLGLPLEVARTHFLLACAVRDDRPETALAEAQAALSTFDGLGASADCDEAAAFIRGLGGPAVRRRPRQAPELTARERDVLALVTEGLSNTDIAGRLFLSRKTVEHHVRSLLAKLGVANRTEAAAYAVRQRSGER